MGSCVVCFLSSRTAVYRKAQYCIAPKETHRRECRESLTHESCITISFVGMWQIEYCCTCERHCLACRVRKSTKISPLQLLNTTSWTEINRTPGAPTVTKAAGWCSNSAASLSIFGLSKLKRIAASGMHWTGLSYDRHVRATWQRSRDEEPQYVSPVLTAIDLGTASDVPVHLKVNGGYSYPDLKVADGSSTT